MKIALAGGCTAATVRGVMQRCTHGSEPIVRRQLMRHGFAALGIAALTFGGLAFAAPAHADPGQAGLSQPFSVAGGPFVGQWGAHGESMTINADGTGSETYRGGSVNFRLGSVQGPPSQPDTTAYGNITSGGNAPPGSYATVTLVDGARGVTLSIANGDNGFPFCKIVNGSKVNPDDCGA